MHLKTYQQETLDTLRRFLETCRLGRAGPGLSGRHRGTGTAQAPGGLCGCVPPPGGDCRTCPMSACGLPTGGGKTILGAHAVAVARDAWIEKDFPLVLWLVPSNTIRLQTVEALKDPRHSYRQALDDAFNGRVRVFDIAEFTRIRPNDIRDHLCLVVGTIQTLRVSYTEGRKVYAHNENLESHFSSVSPAASGLERAESGPHQGRVKYSFANLLYLHRPLMIVDEVHNAVTDLSREIQQRVNPCAIIEFTATPRFNSNILHSVTVQELKREEMIKLPILLAEHDSWQNAVNGAVATRAALEEHARADSQYVRPLVLFQAQPRNQDVTVEVLKNHLMEVEQVPQERIAVATGDQRELDVIDLFDPQCPIEYVITVEALKEDWDCSFAYVFCSVANIRSATAVEQLLGRVLRMPYARRRQAAEPNKAYAHVSELSFQQAARTLVDKLVGMGFEEEEARDSIERLPLQDTLFKNRLPASRETEPAFTCAIAATPEMMATLKQQAGSGIAVHETEAGQISITITGPVAATVEAAILQALPGTERATFQQKIESHKQAVATMFSPTGRGERFTVPQLMVRIQGELNSADTDGFMEFSDWSLLDHPARLEEDQFTIRESVRHFEIDLDGNRIACQFVDEKEQLTLDLNSPVEGWTPENLAIWLDRQVHQSDISQSVLLRWVRDHVAYLTGPRSMHISALMRAKFVLARKLRDMIATYRSDERNKVCQRYLFAPEARVELSFDNGFEFKDGIFRDQRCYRGHFQFRKHFLGVDNVPLFDSTENGEEFQCAQMLDSLNEVTYWVHNVARHPAAFWLPTATDKFYPDFVALLKDGRLLVVEYKGAFLADTPDTMEKQTI